MKPMKPVKRVNDPNLMALFLQPGEVMVADEHCQLRTILGSCVSITLWHPLKRIGGMSHFLLPTRGSGAKEPSRPGYYGDEALALMLDELKMQGVVPSQCQGKIFGGGNMFPHQVRTEGLNVGYRNGEAARALLLLHGIPLVSESLFGVGHRQIVFDVSNGDVWSKQVRPSAQEIEAEQELACQASR